MEVDTSTISSAGTAEFFALGAPKADFDAEAAAAGAPISLLSGQVVSRPYLEDTSDVAMPTLMKTLLPSIY